MKIVYIPLSPWASLVVHPERSDCGLIKERDEMVSLS
jgi:formylmethanofuran dehydrogenase subunit D